MSPPSTQPALAPSTSIPSAATPPASPTMVKPAFFAQHQRLLIGLLPFKDSRQFHEWIDGPYVSGAWSEFRNDFLEGTSPEKFEEPDKTMICQAVKTVLHSRDPKFRVYRPDKTGWAARDHTVRFIVSVIWDNFFGGLWSVQDFNKQPGHYLNVVYEILSFLRASFVAVETQTRTESEQDPVGVEEAHDKELDDDDEPYDEGLYDDGADDDGSDEESDEEPSMGGPYANLNDETDSNGDEGLLETPISSRGVRSRSVSPEVADEDRFNHW